MSKILIKKKTPIIEVLKQYAAAMRSNKKGNFYFLPVWLQEHGDYDLVLIPAADLPQDLQDILKQQHENNRQQTDSRPDTRPAGDDSPDRDAADKAEDGQDSGSRPEGGRIILLGQND